MPDQTRAHLGEAVDTPTLLVPYRVSDKGWFDWNPVQTSVPLALWHRTGSAARQNGHGLAAGNATFGASLAEGGASKNLYSLNPNSFAVTFAGNCRRDVL